MRRLAVLPLLALVAGLLALASPAEAATGLDPTYGDGGVAGPLLLEDPGQPGEPEPVISFFGDVDPLGRVVRFDLVSDQLLRLDDEGDLDADFGEGDGLVDVGTFDGLAVDATDDGIVLGSQHAPDGVLKLHDDGTVDEDFGDGGIAPLTAPGADDEWMIVDVDLAPDGSVYAMVGGSAPGHPVSVHRLLPDGTVDVAFGEGGSVVRSGDDLQRGFDALDATGSGVVFAYNRIADPDDFADDTVVVERLDIDGAPNLEFGDGGVATVAGGALTIDLDDDSSIFLGGAGAGGASVWHLTWDGRLDRRFASGPGVPGDSFITLGVEAIGDGRVAAISQGVTDTSVAVLDPDGAPDEGLGAGGSQTITGQEAPQSGAVGVTEDGRVIAYTRNEGGESARAFLSDFASLLPTITEVTVHDGSVSVEWAEAEADSPHPIRIWQVIAFDVEAEPLSQSVVAGDQRQATVEGLDTLHAHHAISVVPYDDFGPRPASPIVTALATPAAPAPGPAGVVPGVGASAGDGFAMVSWDPVADDGGAIVWGYSVVAVDHDGGALAGWRNVRADVRSAAVPGLANGTAYDVYVFAVTTEGFGEVGAPVAVTPSGGGADPAAPQMSWANVVAIGSGSGAAAVVSFGPPVERGEEAWAVHVIVLEDGAMTEWKTVTAFERQVVVPVAPGAEVYVVAQSASGFGPLTGPITVV